jgi:nitrogen-specific signal transduction histidine kinase
VSPRWRARRIANGGGIRGSAQLLERELANPALAEYTQVIIQEADRLQNLMSRMLSSNRLMHPAPVCIHEILEHVMRLVLAEFPAIRIRRDYDTSLPDLSADWDSLTQATLNIVRNAAQALGRDKDVGAIAVGRYADFIAVDGNPLTNVRELESVDVVIKGGELIKGN